MAKRNPDTTAKNSWIKELREELDALLPGVLRETRIQNLQSLNAIIGSKHDAYFNLKDEVFKSPDEFIARWHKELDIFSKSGHLSSLNITKYRDISPAFKKYLIVFLKRSFLNHFHEWSRVRPKVEDATMWIGQNNANYGLLVTPRFANGEWENDKSEIRSVNFNYWTIGHVLKTGLVVPSTKDGVMTFDSFEKYLDFFEHVLVRSSGSKYEKIIAHLYRELVNRQDDKLNVPLLIPEFRYAGLSSSHIYRLDFTIIDPYSQRKIAIELSPWSTHGYLAKTKQMSQAEINIAARNNFEKEMKKHRDYFKKFNIVVLIYTDTNLQDCDKLFNDEIVPLLSPEIPKPPIPFEIIRKYGLK